MLPGFGDFSKALLLLQTHFLHLPSVIRTRVEANHLHLRMLSPALTLDSRALSLRHMRRGGSWRNLISA